jgi:hypothetical protein
MMMKRATTSSTRRKAKKRKRMRTGASALLLFVLAGTFGFAKDKPKAPESYAVIAGTVFRENGASYPGIDVTLEPGPQVTKVKKQKAVSSPRGEFTFRVPAQEASYTLVVKAPGYRMERKSVSISGDERVSVSILLEPEKK